MWSFVHYCSSPTHCNRPEPIELVCVSQPANQYDFLEGIAKRSSHRSFPEPEVAMIFKTSDSEDAIDLWEVERRLQILLKEVSVSNVLLLCLFDPTNILKMASHMYGTFLTSKLCVPTNYVNIVLSSFPLPVPVLN